VADLFRALYNTTDRDREPFGDHWCGPDRLTREGCLVALYEAEDGSDGQTVEVYCSALPARFHELWVKAGKGYEGVEQKPYTLTTGSGMGRWAAMTAKAISEGMVSLESETEATELT